MSTQPEGVMSPNREDTGKVLGRFREQQGRLGGHDRSGHKLREMITSITYRVRTDEGLMRLAGRGDELAFDEVVRRHRGRIFGFACGVLDDERAAGVLREAFVSAYRDRGAKESLVDVKAWLLVHAARALLHSIRDRHRQLTLERSSG